jgi:hypothetical protein
MTREEYVKVCSQCSNRKFDRQVGVICGLTEKIAAFEGTCSTFVADESAKPREPMEVAEPKDPAAGRKDMIFGAMWFIGGVIATVADIGYIFYGAIIVGAIQFFRGLSNS